MNGSKRSREKVLDVRDRAGGGSADEGLGLILSMRGVLEELVDFLEAEEKAARRRGVSAKRLARLRLISDDLESARKFASKTVKG